MALTDPEIDLLLIQHAVQSHVFYMCQSFVTTFLTTRDVFSSAACSPML